jgi:hypothetical protein
MSSCKENTTKELASVTSEIEQSNTLSNSEQRDISEAFKTYWYSGTAEITSYTLLQSRYGEQREGTAVTIFVTEDLLPQKQVKANQYAKENIPVLKLNKTKKFNTGIYPYSIMTSVFSTVQEEAHALKISNSVQEWCGQTYLQLNNNDAFEIQGHSYFESEADQAIQLEKTWLEDELFTLIRIDPSYLPTGDITMIPAFETLRLTHKEIKQYKAVASLSKEISLWEYTVRYPELNTSLIVKFSSKFPHTIEQWEKNHANGQKTVATKLKRMQTAYWSQNSNKFLVLRDSLGLQ